MSRCPVCAGEYIGQIIRDNKTMNHCENCHKIWEDDIKQRTLSEIAKDIKSNYNKKHKDER